jgi:putative transposase
VLFSSDLSLLWDKLVAYYCLHFQLEFNIHPTAVTDAATLALFMVNLSYRCLQDLRQHQPECGVLDLKAHYRAMKYVEETLTMLPDQPEPKVIARIVAKITSLGRLHAKPADPIAA